MELFKLLLKLKNVKPSDEYEKHSRESLLLFVKNNPRRVSATRHGFNFSFPSARVFWRTVEAGSAIALTGLLLLVVVGGFSTMRSPVGIAGLDIAGLRVEAEAIDIQIQLSGLDYTQPLISARQEENESTVAEVVKKATRAIVALREYPVVQETPKDEAVAIDAALNALAE